MLPHDELLHYGTRGMRWGVRKAEPTSAGLSVTRNAKTGLATDPLKTQKIAAKAEMKRVRTEQKIAKRDRRERVAELKVQKQTLRLQKAMSKRVKKMSRPFYVKLFTGAAKGVAGLTLTAAAATAVGYGTLVLPGMILMMSEDDEGITFDIKEKD